MEIKILKDILESNKEMAEEIKTLLKDNGIYMINFMSSPGSGKTTFIDQIISQLKGKYRIAVIEGDIKTTKDAEKLAKHEVPITQIETSRFDGACHLESSWILKCLESFDLKNLDLVIIENVGNLVCPAEFELGDDARVVIHSVTEGEDKPLKYPLMFNSSQVVVVNKIDLLPHLNYNLDELTDNLKKINPSLKHFHVSSTNSDGLSSFVNYLVEKIEDKKKA